MADPVELQRLVDQGAYRELLETVTLTDVADAWVAYHSSAHAKRADDDPYWWAVEFWLSGTGAWENEDVVRAGLLALVDAAPDDLLGYVGAGPLEIFVSNDESRIRWIEEQAARSPRFRRALGNVWTWGTESNEVAARMEAAAGVRLARPKGWTGP